MDQKTLQAFKKLCTTTRDGKVLEAAVYHSLSNRQILRQHGLHFQGARKETAEALAITKSMMSTIDALLKSNQDGDSMISLLEERYGATPQTLEEMRERFEVELGNDTDETSDWLESIIDPAKGELIENWDEHVDEFCQDIDAADCNHQLASLHIEDMDDDPDLCKDVQDILTASSAQVLQRRATELEQSLEELQEELPSAEHDRISAMV
jgi:hypothetical protein